MELLVDLVSALPLPPVTFYTSLESLLKEIRDLLRRQVNQQIKPRTEDTGPDQTRNFSQGVATSSKQYVGKGWQNQNNKHQRGAGNQAQVKSAPAANSSSGSRPPSPKTSRNTPACPAASAKKHETPRESKQGANIKIEYVTQDIAEANENVIVIFTDASFEQKMPGAESLAKKYGAPEKSTGSNPQIGSIVKMTAGTKQVWYVISKDSTDDKTLIGNKKFYANHDKALKALRFKLQEEKIKRIAISRLGAGKLGVQWRITSARLREIFANDDVNFIVHSLPKQTVTDLDQSAANRPGGERNRMIEVAHGVAGGCQMQLPGNKDPDYPPPQHALPQKVREEEPVSAKVNSLSPFEQTPTEEKSDAATKESMQSLIREEVRRSMGEIGRKMTDALTTNLIGDLRDELRSDIRKELMGEFRSEIRKEIYQSEIRNEILEELGKSLDSTIISPLHNNSSDLSSYQSTNSLNTLESLTHSDKSMSKNKGKSPEGKIP